MATEDFHNPLKDFIRNFKSYAAKVPLRISQRALLEMKNNFTRQGYETESGSFQKWHPRKIKDKKLRRAILIKSGRLRRSMRAAPLPLMPRVVTDVPYAEKHQNGFSGTEYVKAHKRTATITRTIRGGYTGLSPSGGGLRGRAKKMKFQGARHNVKAFSRKVDIKARPFLTVGPSFLNKEEVKLMNELENLLLQAR